MPSPPLLLLYLSRILSLVSLLASMGGFAALVALALFDAPWD
jgi:hypothetical protein